MRAARGGDHHGGSTELADGKVGTHREIGPTSLELFVISVYGILTCGTDANSTLGPPHAPPRANPDTDSVLGRLQIAFDPEAIRVTPVPHFPEALEIARDFINKSVRRLEYEQIPRLLQRSMSCYRCGRRLFGPRLIDWTAARKRPRRLRQGIFRRCRWPHVTHSSGNPSRPPSHV
jgi:hypothetical protein